MKNIGINNLRISGKDTKTKQKQRSQLVLTTAFLINATAKNKDDIKVAVSEACTNAIKHSLDNKFSVEYTIFENGLTITIIDSGKGYDVDSIDVPN